MTSIAAIRTARAVRVDTATQTIVSDELISVADLVEDMGGEYLALNLRHRVEAVDVEVVTRQLRTAELKGLTVTMLLDGKGNWTVTVSDGNGSSYGHYTYNG